MPGMPPTVAEREAELAALQSAFDEYISSSRELEEELDAELAKMQEKLAESSGANAALSAQLENIAPQLSSLEKALSETRNKLDLEQRLRRQAEMAQDESEARVREIEGSLIAVREECDAAHEELAFKESELEETRLELEVEKERYRVELDELRSDLSVARSRNGGDERDNRVAIAVTGEPSSSKPKYLLEDDAFSESLTEIVEGRDDDYVKRLEDELELVTEQLIDTEQRLTQAEEQLAEEKSKNDMRSVEEEKKQKDDGDESLVLKLKEENQVRQQEEQKLKEELELLHEELALTQEELRAAEEDAKQFEAKIDVLRAEHREVLQKLQIRLDQAETDASAALAELETLENTLGAATAETVTLKNEINNLNFALDNAKKDHRAVLEELEEVNQRFDEARYEAEKMGRDSAIADARAEIKADHEAEIAELTAQLKIAADSNAALQEKVDETEMASAVAKDVQHKQSGETQSELVKMLQDQLSRTKDELERKEREKEEIKSNFEIRVAQTERDVLRLEKELRTTKGKLAEAEATLIVIRREKERATAAAAIPQQKTKAGRSIPSAAGARKPSDESRDDMGPINDHSHSVSRRLPTAKRHRARSTSPTTPQRLEYRVHDESIKAKTLQKEYDALKNQNRMGEVRVKRLEEDLKVLQTQLFANNGDTAVVTQMSRISTLASPRKRGDEFGDVRDAGNTSVDEIIKTRDVKTICDEFRKLDKKSAMQREYNAQLLSKILSLQGNIQVCCRVRPMRMSEVRNGNKSVVESLSETELGCFDSRTNKWKSFAFDKVWGPDQSQQSIFQDVEPLALSVVDGYNACIFAYGQTGSGKTYTMEGVAEGNEHGISYRTIQKIFHLLNLRAQQQKASAVLAGRDDESDVPEFHFTLEIGMLEIYNDEVYDLLSSAAQGATAADKKREARRTGEKATLEIRRDADGRIEVPGLTKEHVNSIQDVMDLLSRGNSNRATASTNLNEHSSRSHMVLVVDVRSGLKGQPSNKGCLYLVDLAGSERVRKSKVEGDQLREAGFINKSLAALGNVMEALDRKSSHVPYRDSKLTYLLQDSLGGNSRTMMVVAVCPMDVALDESVHALQFATRVRRIQIGAAQRNVTSKNLEETVKALTSEMKMLMKAKEKSEHQLHSLKRDNLRIQERLHNISESRVKSQSESRTLEVLRKNNHEMANRWQKEKTLREESAAELEKCQKELQHIQQELAKTARERDNLTRHLEEKESALAQSSKDLRRAKDASSAANLRARTAQLMNTRSGSARTPGLPSGASNPTSPTSSDMNVREVRDEVLELLEKYDTAKVDRIDVIMEKFKGKEDLLLDKMRQRYEGGGSAAANLQRRSEMALARHKERMQKRKEDQ